MFKSFYDNHIVLRFLANYLCILVAEADLPLAMLDGVFYFPSLEKRLQPCASLFHGREVLIQINDQLIVLKSQRERIRLVADRSSVKRNGIIRFEPVGKGVDAATGHCIPK